MKKAERIILIEGILDSLFPNPPIPLDHTNNFTLLVAVLLSAQCTDVRVNLITPALFKRFPNAKELSNGSVEEVKELIKTCGLSGTKSKALVGLSKIIVDKHDGKVPDTFEQLEQLPGVGHKTASVIMSQAFDVPAFPVDTHIHRLAKRWKLSSGKNVVQTEKDLKKAFKKNTWNIKHLQMIYFGRTFCPARNHKIENCPICSKI